MNKELKKKTEYWMSLERKTLEQRKEAESFYEQELMELIRKEYVRNNKKQVFEKVECLVVSVGMSYGPIVLNITLLKPGKILFLYTEKSEATLEKVVSFCGLTAGRYEKRPVNEVNPIDVYREIKRIYIAWKKPERMYIDFTGGTKAMSAACALAGAMIDIQMIYVSSSDFLKDFKQPKPGLEELVYIENPVVVFGDLDLEKAMVLFDRMNFAGAGEKLEVLKEKIPDPAIRQQLQFLHLLARAYEAWDAFDFEPAYQRMKKLHLDIMRDRKLHGEYLLMDLVEHIGRQTAILSHLEKISEFQKTRSQAQILESDEIIYALMFTLLQNAWTREKQEKYNMATLLLYRLLELIEQRRLIKYGLYASDPDYMHMRYDMERTPEFAVLEEGDRPQLLKEKVQGLKKAIFKTQDFLLPNQIALLDGFCILGALRDPISESRQCNTANTLRRISQMVFLRNNSIFAHGLGPVGLEDFLKFKNFVVELFQQFCEIEQLDFDAYRMDMEWIQPSASKKYMSGWEG